MSIDDIKNSLDRNKNLSDEVKGDFFEVILLVHKYYPELSLDTLNERIETVQIESVSKFLIDEPMQYNGNTNILQINQKELEKTNNTKHVLVTSLLQMVPKPAMDDSHIMDGFNKGFAELAANSLVGSEEDFADELRSVVDYIITIFGQEAAFAAYNTNSLVPLVQTGKTSSESLIETLQKLNHGAKSKEINSFEMQIEILEKMLNENNPLSEETLSALEAKIVWPEYRTQNGNSQVYEKFNATLLLANMRAMSGNKEMSI